MKFYDISLPITEKIIVYPGNPGPSIKRVSSIPEKSTNSSSITLGSHTGTHVDSKLHISNDGDGSIKLPLDSFYGECRVLDLTSAGKEIHKKDLETFGIKEGEIILIKSVNSTLGFKEFRKEFAHIKLDAAKYLVERGVKTLAVDYLSVKKFGGDHEVHEELINSLTLFEGVDLSEVPPGKYTFIGLPLPIDCDGAPARVVLVKE